MKEEFLIFQKFNIENQAVDFGNLLNENKVEFLIENISINFDPILSNNEFGKEYCVKIKKNDFEKANEILHTKAKNEINEIQDDYYLLSYSNEELIDVIEKSDEWNKFDVELAHKLLKERGNEITAEQLSELRKQRIIELSKPDEGQNVYIIIGYICALLGGLLGIFIGWHLLTYKKTLPNGNRIYAYSENDRKQGNRIIILGAIFFMLWILYRIIK
jgi:hypothetical protein